MKLAPLARPSNLSGLVQAVIQGSADERKPTRVLAQHIARRLPLEEARFLAAELLVELAARRLREDTLEKERWAAVPVRRIRELDRREQEVEERLRSLPVPQQATQSRRRGSTLTPDQVREIEEAEDERRSRLFQGVNQLLEDYSSQLRMEWTEELLSASITLPDGRETTWGEATIEDHQARKSMFLSNVASNLEGAARHNAAIEAISARGAVNLNSALTMGVL